MGGLGQGGGRRAGRERRAQRVRCPIHTAARMRGAHCTCLAPVPTHLEHVGQGEQAVAVVLAHALHRHACPGAHNLLNVVGLRQGGRGHGKGCVRLQAGRQAR